MTNERLNVLLLNEEVKRRTFCWALVPNYYHKITCDVLLVVLHSLTIVTYAYNQLSCIHRRMFIEGTKPLATMKGLSKLHPIHQPRITSGQCCMFGFEYCNATIVCEY